MRGNCEHCGTFRLTLHKDHIWPRALGGGDEPDNIQYLCANCHQDKTRIDIRNIYAWKRRRGIDVSDIVLPDEETGTIEIEASHVLDFWEEATEVDGTSSLPKREVARRYAEWWLSHGYPANETMFYRETAEALSTLGVRNFYGTVDGRQVTSYIGRRFSTQTERAM